MWILILLSLWLWRRGIRRRTKPDEFSWTPPPMKLFYTGPFVNTEMLVMMLEKHGIVASHEFGRSDLPDDGDLNRLAGFLSRTTTSIAPSNYFTASAKASFDPSSCFPFSARLLKCAA